eukprot:gene24591-30956_t
MGDRKKSSANSQSAPANVKKAPTGIPNSLKSEMSFTKMHKAAKFGANPREIPIALCANKIDKRRVVSEDEGRQFAHSRGLTYFEISASSGANVPEMFDWLFGAVFRKVKA